MAGAPCKFLRVIKDEQRGNSGRRAGNGWAIQCQVPQPHFHLGLAAPFAEDYSSKLREARAKGQPIPPFPDIAFEQQVRIVMDHLKKLVEAAGSNMDCLLKVIVWLKDQRQAEEFDRIYRGYFTSQEALPARTRMQAGRTPMDCGLEVEAIGYVP
jgi:2-iminobutanoate/2-iminopropanoate deaminase